MMSWDNYEEYMLLHADGELQPAEEQELMAFVQTHPELKKELELYSAARLAPDATMAYAHKDALLRPEPAKRIIALPTWSRYAIAAGVAALLLIPFFKYGDGNKTSTAELAHTSAVSTITHAPQNNLPAQIIPAAAAQTIAMAPTQHAPAARVIKSGQHAALAQVTTVRKKQEAPAISNTVIATRPATEINAMTAASIQPLPCTHETAAMPMIHVPNLELAVNSEDTRRSFIDRMPLDESNKKQLKTIARIVTNTYNGVTKAKEELYAEQITFSIEDKKLKISY